MAALPDMWVALKAVVVALWLIAFFVLERIRPAAPRGPREAARSQSPLWQRVGDPARLARNGALWLINTVGGSLIVIPLTAWAGGLMIGLRPPWLAGWAGVALDLLLLDLWIYWWHRANHELPWLWSFHSVHHLDRFLDTTSAGRFHVGEVALSAIVRIVPIVVFEISLSSVVIFESAILMAAIFHHSNVSLPGAFERRLARVVITPSIHWVHHHAVRKDTDSNYGTILSLWDRLFGTANASRRHLDMAIGVEGHDEESFLRLMLRPFKAGTR